MIALINDDNAWQIDRDYLIRQLTWIDQQLMLVSQTYESGSDRWAYESYQLRRMRAVIERMLQKGEEDGLFN
jgi:hypothetical protein